MRLDPQTVFVMASVVAFFLGSLLVFTWQRAGTTSALMWWGAALVTNSIGILLIATRGHLPNFWTLGVGLALSILHAAMMWTGARVFDGKPVRPTIMVAGALVYLTAFHTGGLGESATARVSLSACLHTIYMWLAAWQVWRGRSEVLAFRWPAVIVFGLHGAISLTRIPLRFTDPAGVAPGLFADGWELVPEIARLVYIAAAAVILLAMAKERSVVSHRAAALTDSLTLIGNRRAFVDIANRRLRRAARDGTPVAVLIADLDHFKWVNDRFGHADGDRVLRLFADTAVASLRPEDLIGRLGGEEFAALLLGADTEGAAVAAERLRAAFVVAAAEVDGMPVGGTVSIGIASARAGECELDQLLASADGALYLAKARGRNRVESAPYAPSGAAAVPAAGAQRQTRPVLTLVDPREVPVAAESAPVSRIGKPLTH
jgi:diguanylate cyclase (GGDEF)-like protein